MGHPVGRRRVCRYADPTVDYLPASGTLTFAPGQTTATVSITVVGDTVVEPDELVPIALFGATNARPSTWLTFGTILNDD